MTRTWLFILVAAGCGMGARDSEIAETSGDGSLPSAGVGPFRPLGPDEVNGVAPFVLDDKSSLYREPAVLRDGAATLLVAVARRVVAGSGKGSEDVIVRTRALDDRTFFGASGHFGKTPPIVLSADQAWEGGALAGPALVRAFGAVLLYYGGRDGVGVARSTDGRTFRKEPGPILGRDPLPGSWETTAPRGPTVFALPDGRLRMLYAAGRAIGEAESSDGVTWRRQRAGPVLSPSSSSVPAFDAIAVGDPCAVPRITPAGRFHVRVLYTGTDATGSTAIGFAARFGESGSLERQPVPVYSVVPPARGTAAAPALVDLGETSFLYVQQERSDAVAPFLGIAAAIAPVTSSLSPPGDFPDEP